MAYKYKLGMSCADRAAILTELWSKLSDMGWTLHDNQDGSSYRVYSSNGESADRITEYVKIDYGTSNQIRVTAFYYWNNSTHAGLGSAQTYVTLTTAETGQTAWLFGNKNMVYVMNKISTTWYGIGFGHIPKKFFPAVETSLTQNATSGTNVTITVSSTANFIAGQTYQIVGNTQEGRDSVVVSSITNSTQMIISNLPRNYNSGSKIGVCPSTFGAATGFTTSSITFYTTCLAAAAGTGTVSGTTSIEAIALYAGAGDPDARSGHYFLSPIQCYEGTNFVGYDDTMHLQGSASAYTAEDIVYVGRQDSGTSTGSNGSTTLNDTNKLWTADAYNNKVVIISGGTGSGQVRKIADTTTTQLTIDTAWDTTPDATSTYIVADECYMLMSGAWAYKIGI